MGYDTNFFGEFELDKELTKDQHKYLCLFNEKRHFQIKDSFFEKKSKPSVMKNLNIDFGEDGCFYVDEENNLKYYDSSIIEIAKNYNRPPGDCPGLWCGWIPSNDKKHIIWDRVEKFYNYTEWLNFIISKFLNPWEIEIFGSVKFQGEHPNDVGFIRIKDGIAILDKTLNEFL